MGYELREHTADVAVEATATSIGAVFGATADGMAAAMCENWPEGGDRIDVTVSAESIEALLFDYLDELIYERDVRSVLPVDNDGSVDQPDDQFRFTGSYRAVPLSAVSARDLKAVTYSEMVVEEVDDGWRTYVVFDV